jgi:DNA-binding XRE family transcriptional regulator
LPECQKIIMQTRSVKDLNGPVYCMGCLPAEASFGQRLKARRLAAGMTLTALGKACGIAWQMIGFYEQGRTEPKWRTLAKLIRVLGTERLK